jgi:hypothetical protein
MTVNLEKIEIDKLIKFLCKENENIRGHLVTFGNVAADENEVEFNESIIDKLLEAK